jgi:hypothetical protein
MRIFFSVLISITICGIALAQQTELPKQLHEASAVAKKGDVLYWMNDSGNEFKWYITDLSGKLKDSSMLVEEGQIDIEDMSVGKRGHIFVADIGNNLHNRKDLKIHKFDAEGKYKGAIQFNYPNQQLFPPAESAHFYNAEAIAFYDSNIHLFTKSDPETAGYITHHYIVPVLPGIFTSKLMESMVLPERVVTSASVSPDGNYLALLGYNYKKVLGLFPKSETSVFVFPITNKNYFFDQPYKEYEVKSKGATQYEALEWLNNNTLIVGSEKTKRHEAHFQILNLDD